MKITTSSGALHKSSLLFTVKHTTHPHSSSVSHNNTPVHLNFKPATLSSLSLSFSLSVFVSPDLRWTSNLKTTPRWAALHDNKKPLPWPLTRGQVWGSEWYLLMKLWAPNLLHSVRIIQLSAQTGIRQHDGPRHGPSIIYELHRKQPGDNREAPAAQGLPSSPAKEIWTRTI